MSYFKSEADYDESTKETVLIIRKITQFTKDFTLLRLTKTIFFITRHPIIELKMN